MGTNIVEDVLCVTARSIFKMVSSTLGVSFEVNEMNTHQTDSKRSVVLDRRQISSTYLRPPCDKTDFGCVQSHPASVADL